MKINTLYILGAGLGAWIIYSFLTLNKRAKGTALDLEAEVNNAQGRATSTSTPKTTRTKATPNTNQPVLQIGSTGYHVKTLQTKLNARAKIKILGAQPTLLVVDGSFGKATETRLISEIGKPFITLAELYSF